MSRTKRVLILGVPLENLDHLKPEQRDALKRTLMAQLAGTGIDGAAFIGGMLGAMVIGGYDDE